MRATLFAFVTLLAIGGAPLVQAQDSTPQMIKLQGYLTDKSGGTPVEVNGPVSMIVDLYDVEDGGVALASVGPLLVEVTNGFYEALLAFPASEFSSPDRFLELMVDGETLSPRVRLASAPYAHVAETLDGAEAADLDESDEIVAHGADPGAHHFRYTNAEAVAAVAAGGGAGSGLDADLLDGMSSAEFGTAADVSANTAAIASVQTDMSAYRKRYNQVVVVDAQRNGDFTDPAAALDSIVDASSENPYLVQILPGVYVGDLATKPFVDVVGSGREITVLEGQVTLVAGPSLLRAVSIINDSAQAIIAAPGANAVVADAGITGHEIAVDIYSAGGTLRFENVRVAASGGPLSYGFRVGIIGPVDLDLVNVTTLDTDLAIYTIPFPFGQFHTIDVVRSDLDGVVYLDQLVGCPAPGEYGHVVTIVGSRIWDLANVPCAAPNPPYPPGSYAVHRVKCVASYDLSLDPRSDRCLEGPDYIARHNLMDNAVTSAKISDGTITHDDLMDNAVTSAKIADGTITSADTNFTTLGIGTPDPSTELEVVGSVTVSGSIESLSGFRFPDGYWQHTAGAVQRINSPFQEVLIAPHTSGYLTAVCPDGHYAVGRSWEQLNVPRYAQVWLFHDKSVATHWEIGVYNNTGDYLDIKFWAICAPEPNPAP